MEGPQELSVAEIRKYMLENGCKVTNHALVKHFKRFLTNPETQNEARKEFKTYVNILATIKNENNQKFLLLRKKYLSECPSEEAVARSVAAAATTSSPSSPGGGSLISEGGLNSPFRQPPPYKAPPEVCPMPKSTVPPAPIMTGATVQQEQVDSYRECVNEFANVVLKIDPARLTSASAAEVDKEGQALMNSMPESVQARGKSTSRANSLDEQNKENIPRFSFSSGNSNTTDSSNGEKVSNAESDAPENPISVKEATRKFNRMASEEEAKIISPTSKKKPEKELIEDKDVSEVSLTHPKAKEWIVAMAKANYQELAKLAKEYPELVKLQDPATSYTALHWAAKHGNEDVVKLIAGTYKADVNARTNGGYTPLHLAMQFGRVNIFELLCNVYKANRDLLDWSGNKPLDYSKQRTSVSASTYSSEYFHSILSTQLEYDPHGDIGMHTVRSSWVGGSVGGGKSISSAFSRGRKRSQLRYATVTGTTGMPVARSQSMLSTISSSTHSRKAKPTLASFVENNNDMSLAASAIDKQNNNNNLMEQESHDNTHKSDDAEALRIVEVQDLPGHGSAKEETPSPQRGANATRRKQSFFRKKMRATTNAPKNTLAAVTNPPPSD